MAVEEMLICRVGHRSCALPLGAVIETMRPLPVEPVAGTPTGVMGVSIIRGAATVVVDVAALVGSDARAPRRFVTVRAGERPVALAVEAVDGIRALASEELPPLLGDAASTLVARIAADAGELLLVLQASRLLPLVEEVP